MYNLFLGIYSGCNFKCKPCHHYKQPYAESELDFNDLERFIQLFGVPQIVYIGGGGEPTLAKKYPVFIDFFLHREVTVVTISNGSYIKEISKNIPIERINFIISLPSTNLNVYKNFTGCNNDNIVRNIQDNISLLNKNTVLQITLTKENCSRNNIIDITKYAKDNNIKFMNFQFATKIEGGCEECYLNAEEMKDVEDFLNNNIKANFIVPEYLLILNRQKNFNLNSIVLQENGLIRCCCSPESIVLGNVNAIDNNNNESLISWKKTKRICSLCRK